MKKIAIYCRADKNSSLEDNIIIQRDEAVAFCQREQRPYEIFIDKGFSEDIVKRPGLNSLLSSLNSYDTVLCTDLSIISGSGFDLGLILRILKRKSVDLVVMNKILCSNT